MTTFKRQEELDAFNAKTAIIAEKSEFLQALRQRLIVTWRDFGISLGEMCKMLNIGHETIYQLYDSGVAANVPKLLDPSQAQELCAEVLSLQEEAKTDRTRYISECHKSGVRVLDIASDLGVDHTRIRVVLDRLKDEQEVEELEAAEQIEQPFARKSRFYKPIWAEEAA